MFQRFPSLTRFSHGWTVTEKIDGTNACIYVASIDDPEINHGMSVGRVGDTFVFAQSRNKLITPNADNAGFAKFVFNNLEEIVEKMGDGRHYGEWAGAGIQRKYGMTEKVFALFNSSRWKDAPKPSGMTTVPVLAEGYMSEPGKMFEDVMSGLKENGSVFAPGFMDPEGIVMRHGPSGTLFKKTFDYDEQGKWAENQAARQDRA